MGLAAATREKINARIFKAVHGRNLVYNTCWEDPALDRIALEFKPDDRVMVITSAGCNALDYLLAGAGEVNAIDVNPIQNALLELKVAAAKSLDHDAFFALFGQGCTPNAQELYTDAVRTHLSPFAKRYWDRKIRFFNGKDWRRSFYYRGTSGLLAKLILMHARLVHRLRQPIEDLLEADTIDRQAEIYHSRVRPKLWTRWLRWFLKNPSTLSLAGVPEPQRRQIDTQYPGGTIQFIQDSFETVITKLPFRDNYFWRVYFQGHYTHDCCPEYLKRANFDLLRSKIKDLNIVTNTITHFLERAKPGISKFVLLDHMDWMSFKYPKALVEEWQMIVNRARPGARAIFRSAGLRVDFLEHLQVRHHGRETELGELLSYHRDLAAKLHQRDRVHTYGSFYIADLKV